MSKLTIYQKPTCTTCRQVYQVLKSKNVDFNAVDYYLEPLSKAKLKELVKKMGVPAAELFRKKEDLYKDLKLAEKKLTDDQVIELMVKHPDLLQRPIAEKGAKAILARPAEKILDIL